MTRIDRGSLAAAGLVAVALLLGIVCGIALDRWALRPPQRMARPGVMRGDAPRQFDPASARVQFSRRLASQLELTDEQRRQVDSLLARQQAEARAVMQETRPRLEGITARTQAAIRTILTPAQVEKWEAMRRERPQRRQRPRP
jgi:hypothetical protein